jgi:hypothetical protein
LHINQLRSSAIVKGWRALHAGVPSDDDQAIGFMLRIPRGFLGETQAAVPAGSSSARSCTMVLDCRPIRLCSTIPGQGSLIDLQKGAPLSCPD